MIDLEKIRAIGIEKFVEKMSPEQVHAILDQMIVVEDKERYGRFEALFPDEGPLRRALYTKHLEFFKAGKGYRERCFMAGNRVGKTICGSYETACHLTGDYPHWWEGRVFLHPVRAWSAGKTNETTRDIIQFELLGNIAFEGQRKIVDGSGLIPRDLLGVESGQMSWKAGVADLVDTIRVRHRSGGWSELGLKCHPANARVLMANGEWRNIDKVLIGEMIRSPDGSARPVSQLHAYAGAPVLEITTRIGPLLATPNHPIMTQRGMIRADETIVGDELMPIYREPDGEPAEDWRVILTAIMIGDGCTRGLTPFFTCNEPKIVEMVEAILPPYLRVSPVANTISYKIYSLEHHNRLTASLRADGLWGLKSKEKFIPAWVFRLPRPQRVLFLRWLWTCDGSVNPRLAYYSTASNRLIEDARLLLCSLGIFAPIERYMATCNGKKFPATRITLYGAERAAFAEIGKLNRENSYAGKPRPKGPRGEVLSIIQQQRQPVYCVGVEDVHELIVDGFHVGNSYQQGRGSFEGTARHVVWFDEEPPEDVYGEALIRTATTRGIVMLTFTPLLGMSDVVQSFLPNNMRPGN